MQLELWMGDPLAPENRKALFDHMVNILADRNRTGEHKEHAGEDGFLHHSFITLPGRVQKHYDEAHAAVEQYLKDYGWEFPAGKIRDKLLADTGLYASKVTKKWLTISYSKSRNSISIQEFEKGYILSVPKSRIFVVRKRIPLVCISKQVYGFRQIRRRWSPRILTGQHHNYKIIDLLAFAFRCNSVCCQVNLSYKHMIGGKSIADVYISKYGESLKKLFEKKLITMDAFIMAHNSLKNDYDTNEFIRRMQILYDTGRIRGSERAHARYLDDKAYGDDMPFDAYGRKPLRDPFKTARDVIDSITENSFTLQARLPLDGLPF